MRPVLGRLFTPEEDVTGGEVHKVVRSYDLWTARFGSDRGCGVTQV